MIMATSNYDEETGLVTNITVSGAEKVESFSRELLDASCDPWLTFDGETVTITASNGSWKYRITGEGSSPLELVGGLVES